MNLVVLSGYLAQEPKPLGGDKGPVALTISVGQRRKNRDTGEYETKYKRYDAKVWGDLRESVAGLSEGSKVLLTGKLDVDEYEKDGNKVYRTVVIVDNIAEQDAPRARKQEEPDFDF